MTEQTSTARRDECCQERGEPLARLLLVRPTFALAGPIVPDAPSAQRRLIISTACA